VRIRRRADVSWRTAILVTVPFVPAAALVGFVPGWWWWLAATLLVIAWLAAFWVAAERSSRRSR
jgi:hypothetical protein